MAPYEVKLDIPALFIARNATSYVKPDRSSPLQIVIPAERHEVFNPKNCLSSIFFWEINNTKLLYYFCLIIIKK